MGASSSVAGSTAASAIHGSIDNLKDSVKVKKKNKKINPNEDKPSDNMETIKNMKNDNPVLVDDFNFFEETTNQLKINSSEDQLKRLSKKLAEFETRFFCYTEMKLHRNLGDYLAMIGFVEIAVNKYIAILKTANLKHLTDTILEIKEVHTADNIKMTENEVWFLISVRSVLWNFSDASVKLGDRVAKMGFFHYLMNDLKELHKKSAEFVKNSSVFDSAVGILHNCGKSSSVETRECFRKEDTVKNLVPFLQTKSKNVKLLVLLTLANIINEEENHLLLADDTIFDDIIQMIKWANKNQGHRFDGFSVEELVSGLKGLARNDQNKNILMKKGALPLLKEIIEAKYNDGEVLQATEAIRILSFSKDNKNDIKKDVSLIQLLTDLTKNTVENVANAASGILWNIKDDKEKHENVKNSPAKSNGHVMISYQWADQKKLIQISQMLSEAGYLVWMDIKDMEGSTLQAMADAVEKACVVLVCMSERYKESSNCRTEAEYAFTLKKPIIPLMMQRGYKPNGWLGMILGAKLFVDFSGKYSFDDSFKNLSRQLGKDGKIGGDADEVDGPIAVVRSVPLQAARGNGTNEWSADDVSKWLKKISLDSKEKLQSLTGEQLTFLKKLSNRAPEFFFSYVKTDLGLHRLDDLMKFTNAIDQI
ncbi:uncharacterized protein LOC126823259 [Patella vulgata]|uniref:uncharacterized protein LOC126823259 n=1 Tax=Patella vulgata TaxID=6465 RepID=UPI00217F91C2|nr:uncharacterized protein LOC126823259 [Patella vulgata]